MGGRGAGGAGRRDPPAASGAPMTGRYAALVALFGAAGVAAAWLMRERLGSAAARGAMLGAGLATAGALAGMLLLAWALDRGTRAFLAALALGILGRLVVYGATLVYVALRTQMDLMATVGALLAFYIAHQVLEIRFALARAPRGAR